MEQTAVLNIQNLRVAFKSNTGLNEVLHGISYDLFANEILGIVGESGSGKSVASLAIMGLLPPKKSVISSGEIQFKNEDLLQYTPKEMETLRGQKIAMIFQEPMSALNPSMTCGVQVEEILLQHTPLSKKEVKDEVIRLFNDVKIPTPNTAFKKYPHEISGGQQQRVMIAMAIACKPDILIADEPTTALDVTVQKDIIALLKTLQEEYKMSVIFISHDLALVSEIADRILVMYKGNIIESGDTKSVFKTPKEDYTKALIGARPTLKSRLKQLPTISDFLSNTISKSIISKSERAAKHKEIYSHSPLLEVINLEKEYFSKASFFGTRTAFKAVDAVSFKVYSGETMGLVGESGCGKSTLGKAILQLDKATAGTLNYKGNDITNLNKKELRSLRKEIQIIFQDPYASLNPRLTVGKAIMEPMKVHKLFSSDKERKAKTLEILEKVGLEASHFERYPHEFSGGQRQRIGIARTIAVQPKLIICDESVSALDISVQAQVLNLLNTLKDDYGFTYIFISHDLAVVKFMSDQLMVMNKGKIEELGEADSIYESPQKAYTKTLIEAIPKGL
ncbi:ABC transporter ATP-binding protein [Flavobacteriaceae bacterium]|jgi:peptide/nickel transport system ATP-binding protein|nr:ABC transporter ATP-binding protein [Flavobacteriaceae bacterium]MDA7723974.1 ABC transporter ATP-binding protein [Flavobacteriaceae bacterium]MDA7727519.1 ABC transporter ATP-binding protein [Flavobacteriaceae bacterium]MDB0003897.1 ABC transporter ATP-binding protein [Flavobacteriaceae bacterium]|tara:strand:+ start:22646 stop:24337 length:1692 start_codon:yes stop_codon:yes gene_type:complete